MIFSNSALDVQPERSRIFNDVLARDVTRLHCLAAESITRLMLEYYIILKKNNELPSFIVS